MATKYTKADLEELISVQLENLMLFMTCCAL